MDENVFIELPALYTRPGIPVSKDDIPKQVDVDRWPYLNDVNLPDVEAGVGLLIASDVPMALDPLEVKHNQDGSLYASRTSLGWVGNAPLGRNRYGLRASSFYVKTDVELRRMVKNFYDSGFGKSSADEKPEVSQEEIRFLNVLDSTIALRSGHYEMALPLKDREAPMPNNRVQAER